MSNTWPLRKKRYFSIVGILQGRRQPIIVSETIASEHLVHGDRALAQVAEVVRKAVVASTGENVLWSTLTVRELPAPTASNTEQVLN